MADSDSTEVKTLKAIQSKNYPDTNKDFVKNISRLNSSVDYISSYMIVMQKGIDSANESIIEQIQGFVQDLIVLFAGGEPTGIKIGDLKYIIQALGALFGFGGAPFPLNLLNAAQHFFLGYVVPLEQFTDVIFDTIFAWAEELGLSPAFIDVLRDFADSITELGADIYQLLSKILGIFDIFGIFSGSDLSPLSGLWDTLSTLFDTINANVFKPILNAIAAWTTPFIQLLTAIVDMIDSVVDGLSGGLVDPLNILGSLVSAVLNIPIQLMNIIGKIFSKTFTIPSQAGSFVGSLVSGVFGWLNGFFKAVTGQDTVADPTTPDVTVTAAVEQAEALVISQINNAIAIAQLQAQQSGQDNSGLATYDDFERDNNTDINSSPGANDLWNIVTVNPLSYGFYALINGQAVFTGYSSIGDQTQFFRRKNSADQYTQTDYQKIGGVIGSFAGDPPFLSGASWIRLRGAMNDAETQEVWVNVWSDNTARFGYRNGGADTFVGNSVNIGKVTAATQLYLVCGTIGGVNYYQLLKGNTPVHAWIDTGNLVARGASNRGWGWAGHSEGVSGGRKKPASMALVSAWDNVPAPVPGTYLKVSRVNTATFSVNVGSLVGNAFDSVDKKNGIDFNAGVATILTSGLYVVRLRLKNNSRMPRADSGGTIFSLAINGVEDLAGHQLANYLAGGQITGGGNVFIETQGPANVYYTSWEIPLSAGQTVQGLVKNNNGASTYGIVGSAGGLETYMTIAKVG